MRTGTISITCYILSLLFCNLSSAKTFTNKQAEDLVAGASQVTISETRNSVSFVRLRESNFVSASSAESWLLKFVLQGRPDDRLQLYKTDKDQIGYTHLRYRQLYRNVPVEYSMYIVHTSNGKINSANGEFYPGINVQTQPAISAAEALQKAKDNIRAVSYRTDPAVISPPQLVILGIENGVYKLAYKTDVYADKPLSRNWIYVDASNGNILKKTNRIETIDVSGIAATEYSGARNIRLDSISSSSFRLYEGARGAGAGTHTLNLQGGTSYATATDFTNTVNSWPLAYDNAALDAHYGAEKTYDHYYSNYGYNSFDNAGGAIFSYVHYDFDYVNAFWDGTEMTYGDGDGIQYSPLTSLEIVGHEITHGVTERSAALVYAGESGALNESFSDIMGNTIRFNNAPAVATWLVGDQIVIPGGGGTPFRNFANPNDFECADTYGGTYWNNGDIVHYDSGVQNFWYYLLTAGGTGTNDNGDAYTVNGIGLTDANAIVFRNLTMYLTPNSTFSDARTYAIQSAVDLFGSCSNQEIQTTNAWYAVGVGGVFSNAVIASFSATQNYFCSVPATVNFTNSSINSISFNWNFGDGGTSTSVSPIYIYNAPGVYTVHMVASGSASCGNTDSTTLVITVTNGGGPVSASCTPVTSAYCCGIGITRVQINTINNTSGNASEGYKDFSCSNSTTLIAGDPYPLTVTTGFSSNENVKAWIDYNNDGVFNTTNEQVLVSTNELGTHTAIIHTPVTAVLNTALRMRVIDDNSSQTISSACYNPMNGQAEDYSISFIANTAAPVANFIASDTIVNVGSTVNFTDLSIHAPTSWSWSFPGGTSANTTAQNPSATYNVVGNYAVTLHATNSFGSDSITKLLYIHVVNYINMCSATSTTSQSGLLYDSGGPLGSYQDDENCSLLIAPACATSVTLTFQSIDMESCCDQISVYNGPNATSPLLLTITGTTIPSPIIATSGKMFITFSSDVSVVYSGFAASWSSVVVSSSPPVADFTMSDSAPSFNVPVQFTDISTNSPVTWNWDFGDGNTSTLQNPTHAYTTAGSHVVTLIAYTCGNSDTVTHTVTVQAPPSETIYPHSLNVSVGCGGTTTASFTVHDNSGGDLSYYIDNMSSGSLEVLSLTYGTDSVQEYLNTLTAINEYFTNYHLSSVNTTSGSQLQAALVGKNTFLMTEPEIGTPSVYLNFATPLQNFVINGGTAILCGASGSQSLCITNTGLLSGSFYGDAEGSTLNVVNTTHPVTAGVSATFLGSNGTYAMDITNPDKVSLVEYNGHEVAVYRNVGLGKVIFLAFDYYSYDDNAARLVANAMHWSASSVLPTWMHLSQNSDTVSAGDSSVVTVTFQSTGLIAGVYTSNIIVHTNDPVHPIDTVHCTMTVTGSPSISLSAPCISFGTIVEHTNATDTVYIHNSGCDSLTVSSVVPGLPQYTTNITGSFSIPPYDSAMVIVHFSPSAIGTYNCNLVIHNNDVDTIICLNGAASTAPVISTSPVSFDVTLQACEDSITVPLTIYNTGGSDLYCTFGVHGNGNALDTTILVIEDNTPWNLDISSFLQTHFGITPTIITSSQVATTDFMQYDIVVTLGDQSYSYYEVISSRRSQFEAYLSSGGIVQYQMAMMASDSINLAGGAKMVYGNMEDQNTGLQMSHPIFNGVTNPLLGNYANHSYLDNLPAGAQVLSETSTLSLPTTIEYNYGDGVVIATGMTWEYLYYNSYNSGQMLPNCFSYLFSKLGTGADLSFTNVNDTIEPGTSEVIAVTVASGGLEAGTYTSTLVIHSNDPLTPNDTIPFTIHVGSNPCAEFSYTTFNCSGAVNFTSNTINNPISYKWTFSDGDTSSQPNPTHVFTSAGNYTAQLIVCNAVTCDTVTQELNIGNASAPIPATCTPATTANCCGIGITNVTFNGINNTTGDGSEGYQDYSCTDTTTVYAGSNYPIHITTGIDYAENVVAWIDYNDDGDFTDAGEQVFISLNTTETHAGTVSIPLTGVVFNTPLRMRVASDYDGNTAPAPCTNVEYGQVEDYRVTVSVLATGIETNNISCCDLNIFPNPFTNETFIEYTLKNSKKVTLEVYNMIGEKTSDILKNQLQAAGKFKYKLKMEKAGMYFVKFTTDDGSVMKRIVNVD